MRAARFEETDKFVIAKYTFVYKHMINFNTTKILYLNITITNNFLKNVNF